MEELGAAAFALEWLVDFDLGDLGVVDLDRGVVDLDRGVVDLDRGVVDLDRGVAASVGLEEVFEWEDLGVVSWLHLLLLCFVVWLVEQASSVRLAFSTFSDSCSSTCLLKIVLPSWSTDVSGATLSILSAANNLRRSTLF